VGAKWQKIDIEIPDGIDPKDRAKLADDIIEFIVDRTKKGYDKHNSKFPKYSKEYIASLDFKIAGKSKSRIDLTLSGDMLAALKVIKTTDGKITIGFDKGSDENARADGNIRGTYGAPSPNRSKARDFLGIKDADLERIVSEYVSETGPE